MPRIKYSPNCTTRQDVAVDAKHAGNAVECRAGCALLVDLRNYDQLEKINQINLAI